ncbi:DNA-binding protein WhiA, partial [Burkholderia multivorans]
MALTAQVKDELARVKITRTSARKAEVSSIFRFSSALHLVNGSIVLEAELDTAQAAKRLRSEIKELYGQFADIVVINAAGLRRSNRYLLRVTRDGGALARQTGLVDNRGRPVRGLPSAIVNGSVADAEAAWRGAFPSHRPPTQPGRSPAPYGPRPRPQAALAVVAAARPMG